MPVTLSSFHAAPMSPAVAHAPEVASQPVDPILGEAAHTCLESPIALTQCLADKAAAYLPAVSPLIEELAEAVAGQEQAGKWIGLKEVVMELRHQLDTCRASVEALRERLSRIAYLHAAARSNATSAHAPVRAKILEDAIEQQETALQGTCRETYGHLEHLQATLQAVQKVHTAGREAPLAGDASPPATRIHPVARTALRVIVAVKGVVALIMAALKTPHRQVVKEAPPAQQQEPQKPTAAETAWNEVVVLRGSLAPTHPVAGNARAGLLLASDKALFDRLQSHDADLIRLFAMYDLITRIDEFPPATAEPGKAPPRLTPLLGNVDELKVALDEAILLYPDGIREDLGALAQVVFPPDAVAPEVDQAPAPDIPVADTAVDTASDRQPDVPMHAASGWTATSDKVLQAVGGMLGLGLSVLAWPVGAVLHYSGADTPTAPPGAPAAGTGRDA